MPDFLLPKYRPKIIDTISKENIILGKVSGINIKPIDFSDKVQLERYIQNILKIKAEEDTNLYIEDCESFSSDIIDYIEKNTELNFSSGDNIRILNIPDIIQEVHKLLNQDYNGRDTLVICSNRNTLLYTLNILSEYIKFITVVGIDRTIKEEVYEEILELTGISIFQPNNLEKVIKNYGIIINFNDVLDFNINGIRNEALILDFSKIKPFKGLNNKKKNIVIEEINFESGLDNKWLDKRVTPGLLESLNQDNNKTFRQILTKNHFYFIKDFISKEIKWRGRF